MEQRDLFEKYVKFTIPKEKRHHYGFVASIELGILNIRGIEQSKGSRPAYHLDMGEVIICSHKEVFKLGQKSNPEIINL